MADVDLTQYNPTPSFPATGDVGTNADPFLVPTDGKIVTASSNLSLEAPVNKSVESLADRVLGLRQATIGDTGNARKSFKSILIDGAGGGPSSVPDGDLEVYQNLQVDNGNLTVGTGTITATNGNIIAERTAARIQVGSAADVAQLRSSRLAFLGTTTGAGGSNPTQSTSIANELRAVNIPKAACFIRMTAPGAIASFDGYGIQSVNITGPSSIQIIPVDTFASNDYCVVFGDVSIPGAGQNPALIYETVSGRIAGTTIVSAWDIVGGHVINFMTTAISFSVQMTGRQTT